MFLCGCLCSKYYEREALMHDSVFGPILAALLGEYHQLHAAATLRSSQENQISPGRTHSLQEGR